MSVKGIIGFQGIKTAGNELTHPPGTLLDALNCVLREKDILEPRRGQPLSTYVDNDNTNANANIAKEIYQWGPHLLVHYAGNAGSKLAIWKNWATSPSYTSLGTFAEPDPTICRMKFAELVRSLFYTTTVGLYALDSSTGTPRKAGLIEPRFIFLEPDSFALYTRLAGNPSASGSWLAKNKTVAARAVIGRKDANNRIVLSAPSARLTLTNPNDVVVAIGSLARVSNVVTATVTAHKFRVGDTFTLSPGEASFAAGTYTVTGATSTTVVWGDLAANATSTVQQTISSGTKSIQWAVKLPPDAVAGDFVRIYRTDESAGEAIDPGDECFLSYERALTTTNISNGYVVVFDTTPSGFLAEPLPTNPNSGDGPNKGRNDRPPLMRDVCVWDGRMWGLETTDRHRLMLRVIGVSSPDGLQVNDVIAVNMIAYTMLSSYWLYTSGTATANVDKTTRQLAHNFGGNSTTTGILSFQRFDGDTGLGEVLLEQRDLADTLAHNSSGAVNAIYAATTRTTAFGDPLATLKQITKASTSRTGSTVTVRCTAHGFTAGEVVMIAFQNGDTPDANFPPGLKTVVTVVDANNFTYTETGAAATLSPAGEYYVYRTTYKSDNGRKLLRFSKQDEPEAWPLPFSPDGFPDGAEGYRILPLASGNGLVVALKDGGFYLVSGSYPYQVEPLDKTADLVAPDTLKEHAGTLFALTSQGIAAIGGSGVNPVSQDVDDKLRFIINAIRSGAFNPSVPWATSYVSENQYILALPWQTPQSRPTYVTHQLVFHSGGAFTRWSGRRTCGLIWKGSDKLVLGDGVVNRLRVELKQLNGAGSDLDYNDYYEDFLGPLSGTASVLSSTSSRFTASGLGSVGVGDVLYYAGNETFYRVTAVGSGYVDFDSGVLTGSIGDVYIFRGYDIAITWAGDPSGAPGVESRWRQLQLHFKERLFDKLFATFAGEKSNSTETVTVRGQASGTPFAYFTSVNRLSTLRAKVPDGLERVAIQTISLTMHEALSFFRLLGRSGSSQSVSERTGQ